MRTFINIIGLIIIIGTLTSCYKDKGNYEYTSLGEILISGIESEYVVLPGSGELVVDPAISSIYKDDEFQHTWVLYSGTTPDTIGREKVLLYIPNKSPGTYDLIYYIQNKSNGHQAHFRSKITMGRVTGHYILKETPDGNTEVDLLYINGDLGQNMLETVSDGRLQGKPRSMSILYGKDYVDPSTLLRAEDNCISIVTYDQHYAIYRPSVGTAWEGYPVGGSHLECLYMGSYRNIVYAFIKDTASGKLYRYTISPNATSTLSMVRPPSITNVTEVANSLRLYNAKLFASNEWSTNVFYYVGQDGKTYYFNLITGVESELVFQGLSTGEEITYLANRYSSIGSSTNEDSYFDYLTIATTDGTSYTLQMYKMIGGMPDGAPVKTVRGEGKVKEVHFLYLEGTPSLRGIHFFSK